MNEEDVYRNRMLFILLIILFIVGLLNYCLIFIGDTTIEDNIFIEEGIVTERSLIPRNFSETIALQESGEYTQLVISGDNGSCTLYSLGNESFKYRIVLNPINNTYSLTMKGNQVFSVEESVGNMTYRYRLYSINKPYAYIGILAFLISIIGFAVGMYLLYVIILARLAVGKRAIA